jgi:hypothetical protein
MFVESSFFLKPGVEIEVELELPPDEKRVHVRAQVVRVETPVGAKGGRSGLAFEFTEYLEDSQLALASYFLGPVVREFLEDYAAKSSLRVTPQYLSDSVNLLAAWELRRSELSEEPMWAKMPPEVQRPVARRR